MRRDQGPAYNLGFGVTSRDLGADGDVTEGPNPTGGVIAKSLHDHPVMRFFAVSAATLVATAVASETVRKGGIKLGIRMQESGIESFTRKIADLRVIRDELDDLQGVVRSAEGYAEDNKTKLFWEDAKGKIRYGDKVYTDGSMDKGPRVVRGFYQTQAEREQAIQYGRRGLETPSSWTMKDELTQRMVSQARRLPYELPAAYVAQRGVTDKLFGEQDPRKKVNWANPVDVITDFVTQGVKNAAFMFTPFELAQGSAAQGWRRAMTYGDNVAGLTPAQRSVHQWAKGLEDLLAEVGQDATKIINKGVSVSGQSTGAFAAGVKTANENQMNLVDFLHWYRHGTKAAIEAKNFAGMSRAQIWAEKSRMYLGLKDPNIPGLPGSPLDALPGPFKGMASGIAAARKEWSSIGEQQAALQRMMKLGYNGFRRQADTGEMTALNEALQGGASPIEDLLGALNKMTHGQPVLADGKVNPNWKRGQFYDNRANDAFNARFREELRNEGVSVESIVQFQKVVGVQRPNQFGRDLDISERVFVNNKNLQAKDHPELWQQVAQQLATKDSNAVVSALPKALQRADQMFKDKKFLSSFDKQVANEWQLIENQLVPRLGEAVLGKNRLPYQMFQGNLSAERHSMLVRKTAEVSGLRLRDDAGNVVSDAMVQNHLRRFGFDPRNIGEMRGFLAQQKAITAPWRSGRNILGFKAVSVEEAFNRGYFSTSGKRGSDVQKLLSAMAARDPSARTGSFKMGGLYEAANGEVLDFNLIRKGIRKFTDKIADEFQIPLIHLSPLKLAGHSEFRNMRDQSMLQYLSGKSFQPFVGKKESADFYMWMRAKARGSKGIVSAFNMGEDGILRESVLAGKYRLMPTIGNTIGARQVKIAAGDMGRIAIRPTDESGNPRPPSRRERFRSAFNVSDDQPDSVGGWIRRFRRRRSDVNNPATLARLLRGEEISVGQKRLVRRGNQIIDLVTGEVHANERQLAEAFDDFPNLFRVKGIPHKLEKLGLFEDTFSAELRTVPGQPHPSLVGVGRHNIGDIKSNAQLIEFGDYLAKQDLADVSVMPQEVQTSMRRAQRLLIYRHIANEPTSPYWDTAVPGVSSTISTRADQFRADIHEYMIMRKGLMRGDQAGFDNVVADLTSDLSRLKASGQISQAQYIEARSALLGTQLDFVNLKVYGAQPSMLNTQAAMSAFTSGRAGQVSSDLLTDVIEGRHDVNLGSGWAGRFGRIQPFLKKHLGAAPYKYAGQEYNPFSQGALVPTFSTSFAQNPLSAVASVIGLGTKGFSGSSIPMGHLVDRLNKSFGIFGGGLNPSKYSGAMDMYARGLVGQRMLPLVAGGTAAVALDRTLGGFVNPRDEQGNRVYSPFVLGGVATGFAKGQAALAGILPGGETYEQKYHELFEGEVPIRSGRWWPLGNTPWRGGRIQYYRPSWYRRLKSGYSYTDQTYGSPMERLAFGYDFSPLRPLDPYRFERQHYKDRPYPTSGEYFTGPWGPVTSVLNASIGRLLKPKISMHDSELQAGLSEYLPTGEQGAFYAPPGSIGAQAVISNTGGGGKTGIGMGRGSGSFGAESAGGMISGGNRSLAAAGSVSLSTGRNMAFGDISRANAEQASWAYGPISTPGAMSPRIIGGAPPISTRSPSYQARQFGYELQEAAGIYGFAFGTAREALGFGNLDMTTPRPVLESAGRAYGSTRGFWSLGLGGLGDVPTPLEGNLANLEISEIIRRFVPRERTGTEFINPIHNQMGKQYPWLPGDASGYYINFHTGDPFTKVPEGEMRLPGTGYMRFNKLHPDQYGEYGLTDIHKILGDVAPWSQEYRRIDRLVGEGRTPEERQLIATTREQVGEKAKQNEFYPYEHRELIPTNIGESIAKGWEEFQHWDSPFHTKFIHHRTAVEDWERDHVYGSTFPQWQHPIRDYIEPMMYRSTQRNPLSAALVLAGTGSLFGKTAQGKVIGTIIGGGIGMASSVVGKTQELMSGRRYMPEQRRKEVALEEYTDILTYVKNQKLAAASAEAGDTAAASEYRRRASTTMYGMDVYNAPVEQLAQAIPRRKREHFMAMLEAPEGERDRILSTSGRLERRAFQAVWGRPVEARPDLNEYFQTHELPPANSGVWNPNTSMEQVKIKVGQSMGLDMAQMGYYPQQIREANLVNPEYPTFNQGTSGDVRQQLRALMLDHGIMGDVQAVRTPYAGNRLEINAGVF